MQLQRNIKRLEVVIDEKEVNISEKITKLDNLSKEVIGLKEKLNYAVASKEELERALWAKPDIDVDEMLLKEKVA